MSECVAALARWNLTDAKCVLEDPDEMSECIAALARWNLADAR